MGKIEYLNSIIYLVEEPCIYSKIIQRDLVKDNNYQILTNGDWFYQEYIAHFIS